MNTDKEKQTPKSDPPLNIGAVSGSFYWETEYFHNDNSFTMQDFIENHLPPDFEVILDDGSYAEVQQQATDAIFSLNAKGNGDSFHHAVDWRFLR